MNRADRRETEKANRRADTLVRHGMPVHYTHGMPEFASWFTKRHHKRKR